MADRRKTALIKSQRPMIVLVVTILVLFYVVFVFFPMGYSIIGSLFNWNIARGTFSFNGFENYKSIFRAPKFVDSIWNSVFFSVVMTLLRCTISMVIAVIITFSTKKLKDFYQTCFFLPIIISMVATSYLWKWFFDGKNGLINFILSLFGMQGPNWLNDSSYSMLAIIITTLWKDIGFGVVLYLAGIAQISPSIFEAAQLDGATKPKIFVNIILPVIGNVTAFLALTSVIGYMQSFDQFYIMTEGGPGTSSYIMGLYLYELAFRSYDFGKASAVSVVMFSIIFVLSVISSKLNQRSGE